MTKTRKATFRCYVTIEFEEDTSFDSLICVDQAFEQMQLKFNSEEFDSIELVEVE